MAIDQRKIIDAVWSMGIRGNEEGIIPVFGVYLTNMYADYYNSLSFGLEKAAGEELLEATRILLIQAAQDCANNTFHGIWKSVEWKSLVEPMIEKKEDIIYGFVAVSNALGWGNWEVAKMDPATSLVMKAYDSYESAGYLKKFGKADTGKCYMLTGVTAGFMDLVYGEEFPKGINTFIASELKCKAKGDPHCEFIATRFKMK